MASRAPASRRPPAGGRRPQANASRTPSGSQPQKRAQQRTPKPAKKAANRKAPNRRAPNGKGLSRKEKAIARDKERMRQVQAKAGNRWRRYYDLEGPKVRLGVVWFIAQVVGIASGPIGVSLVMGVTCAAAAAHTLRTWRVQGRDTDPTTALVGTAVVVAAAMFGPRVMGVALLLLVVGGIAYVVQRSEGAVTPQAAVARAGMWLQCSLAPALAGGCVVLLEQREPVAALALVVIVSAFDCGDFLIGSGSTNSIEGPVAGAAAVVVTTLAISSFGLLPFETTGAIVFGSLIAILAPAGQYLATAMLPHSRSFAPALRRIDSLLLAAPLWYFGLNYILL